MKVIADAYRRQNLFSGLRTILKIKCEMCISKKKDRKKFFTLHFIQAAQILNRE